MQIILKLMPYVFPKVMDVQSTKDEPLDFTIFLATWLRFSQGYLF